MPWVAAGLPLGWRQVDSNSRQPNADPAATRVNQKLLGPFVLSASLTNKTSRSNGNITTSKDSKTKMSTSVTLTKKYIKEIKVINHDRH